VVVSARSIPSPELQSMINEFPNVQFAVNCHSNVGFLQADSSGVHLVREAMEIERATPFNQAPMSLECNIAVQL